MKPGERIRLITESADSLIKRAWAEAQLTLDQFGFQTYEPDKYRDDYDEQSYFVQAIKDGGDDNLLDLHMYLLADDAAPSLQHESDHPWGSQPVRVFLSHKYEDRVFVGSVKKILGDYYGIDAFVAHDDIDPSKRWRSVIKAGLATCDVLIAVLHPEFHASQWCDQEVGWALRRNIPVAAVRRDTATRTQDGFLEEHQDITLGATHGSGEGFLARQIFQLILNDSRTHEKGLRALAETFVNSFGYDNTRALWTLIEQEPRWESEHLRRFEYAVVTNPQVYRANANAEMMPDLVKRLVEKLEPPAPEPAPDPWGSEPPF
jgi:hypothetical protein